ncbi:MAG: YraN family protein [Actinobacteria bacterium]|nr:YraN family protein [Actinomycetota bacterium]
MKEEGYFILHKNYRNKYGEIDIIAQKGRNLIFTEVKTRTNLEYGDPLETINKLKISRIKRSASFYIARNKLSGFNPSFNVISIIISRSFIEEIAIKESTLQAITSLGALKDSKNMKIEHIENAF